ncbi:Eco57I restriction-modification methylase domain-containing protein [Nocardia sp. NPDC055029]
MRLDSIVNRGEYFSAHYLAEVLPKELKKVGQLARWTEQEKLHRRAPAAAADAIGTDDAPGPNEFAEPHQSAMPTPRQGLRALGKSYFANRPYFADINTRRIAGESLTAESSEWHKKLHALHGDVLCALGFDAQPRELTVERAGGEFNVNVAYADEHLVAIECGWAVDVDAALADDQAGKLLSPVSLSAREELTSGTKLAKWLFAGNKPPRYVLLLAGGVVILADRATWGEGRYLGVSLDVALGRNDIDELSVIGALLGADSLLPPAEGGSEPLAELLASSRNHAVGVSKELREGLKQSVELIANEVLDRLRAQGIRPEEIRDPAELAKELGREALRYLYRILFLLYAEARPELGILPTDDQDYSRGYGLARLGDLVVRDLSSEEARSSFHLYESLDLLFRLVNKGHRPRTSDEVYEDEGLRFEPMRSDLFGPEAIELISKDLLLDDDGRTVDTRLTNDCLYQVLRKLMLAKGGRNQRGGFISYAQLGINQLGAVYEGLMSYTGFIATEDLLEVATNGDPKGGSWLIPASKEGEYSTDVFVHRMSEDGTKTEEYMRYSLGSFVYRLAGRDRETSASYYTPESLTSVTVQLALQHRLDQNGTTTTAQEILSWKICEPALGSGAFLNEAINQVAVEYLKRRQRELGLDINPENYELELQKAKAYIALHNSYGVDLNETAVELAEVSLWLNVMHPGLQAPWFGLHLRRGNSLIGAGRKVYSAAQLTRGEWLGIQPTDLPFPAGRAPAGNIHHFLVPADGWGAVVGNKDARALAKALVPEQVKQLSDWRRGMKKKVSDVKAGGRKLTQIQRLQALSGRVEYLWDLVVQRLTISEQEIGRKIDVWGADWIRQPEQAVPKEKVYQDLTAPGTPYWRLKKVMDAWCALWFWPLDKAGLLDGTDATYTREHGTDTQLPSATVESSATLNSTGFEQVYITESLFSLGDEQLDLADYAQSQVKSARKPQQPRRSKIEPVRNVIPLKNLDDWLDFAESTLGRADVPADSLVTNFVSLSDLEEYEDELPTWMGMDPWPKLEVRFPWLWNVRNIAENEGFFHWDLQLAQIFNDGGFDLQVGNPPWVRPDWKEDAILAEWEPWFKLTGKSGTPAWRDRKLSTLAPDPCRSSYFEELANNSGVVEFLGSAMTYPILNGTRPDFYRAFMCQTWSNTAHSGIAGLIHPDTHFGGVKDGTLRAATYPRLRLHGNFVNAANWAFDIGRTREFGVHIYGEKQEISFDHLSQMYDARTLVDSFSHSGEGETPGQKYRGDWDRRPHRDRIIRVNEEILTEWGRIGGMEGVPANQVPLLFLVSVREQAAITALGRYPERLRSKSPQISAGYNETTAQNDGQIKQMVGRPESLDEVILQGSHFSIATPFAKEPNDPFNNSKDWISWNHRTLPEDAAPRTLYMRTSTRDTLRSTRFYRLAWRKMIDPKSTERSLFAALIPPGPAHIHGVYTLTLPNDLETLLAAGFWAALPLDYLVRLAGKQNLQDAEAQAMPAGTLDHPLAPALLFRMLRMNCMTEAYAPLWERAYDPAWRNEKWAAAWPELQRLSDVDEHWDYSTPFRSERERRAALVEADALVAAWLGMDADHLVAIYRGRYPILVDREFRMWFDNNGRRIAEDPYAFGYNQTKEHFQQLMAHLDPEIKGPAPDGYAAPFHKADRESEYRQAHAVFVGRLREANWPAPHEQNEGRTE